MKTTKLQLVLLLCFGLCHHSLCRTQERPKRSESNRRVTFSIEGEPHEVSGDEILEQQNEKINKLEMSIKSQNDDLQYLMKETSELLMEDMNTLKENLKAETTKTSLRLSEDIRNVMVMVMLIKTEQAAKNTDILQKIEGTKTILEEVKTAQEKFEEKCCDTQGDTSDLEKQLNQMKIALELMENRLINSEATNKAQNEKINQLEKHNVNQVHLTEAIEHVKRLSNFQGQKLDLTITRINKLSENVSRVEESCKTVTERPDIPVVVRRTGPEIARMLRIGTRVVRGEDWSWGNQDGEPAGEGTIVSQLGAVGTGWVRVEWDSGHLNNYRMGEQGKYDLKLALPVSNMN